VFITLSEDLLVVSLVVGCVVNVTTVVRLDPEVPIVVGLCSEVSTITLTSGFQHFTTTTPGHESTTIVEYTTEQTFNSDPTTTTHTIIMSSEQSTTTETYESEITTEGELDHESSTVSRTIQTSELEIKTERFPL
jgi:hypothetical protein